MSTIALADHDDCKRCGGTSQVRFRFGSALGPTDYMPCPGDAPIVAASEPAADVIPGLRTLAARVPLFEDEIQLLDRTMTSVTRQRQELLEWNQRFDIYDAAMRRGIKLWQTATGRDDTWPDAAAMIAWLLVHISLTATEAVRIAEIRQLVYQNGNDCEGFGNAVVTDLLAVIDRVATVTL